MEVERSPVNVKFSRRSRAEASTVNVFVAPRAYADITIVESAPAVEARSSTVIFSICEIFVLQLALPPSLTSKIVSVKPVPPAISVVVWISPAPAVTVKATFALLVIVSLLSVSPTIETEVACV